MLVKFATKGFAWAAIFVLLACSNGDEKAAKLYAEAHQALNLGIQTEDISDRLRLYKAALSKLEAIISQYPSTDLAAKLIQEEATIGGFTLGKIKFSLILQTEKAANIISELEESGKEIDEFLKKEKDKGKPE